MRLHVELPLGLYLARLAVYLSHIRVAFMALREPPKLVSGAVELHTLLVIHVHSEHRIGSNALCRGLSCRDGLGRYPHKKGVVVIRHVLCHVAGYAI